MQKLICISDCTIQGPFFEKYWNDCCVTVFQSLILAESCKNSWTKRVDIHKFTVVQKDFNTFTQLDLFACGLSELSQFYFIEKCNLRKWVEEWKLFCPYIFPPLLCWVWRYRLQSFKSWPHSGNLPYYVYCYGPQYYNSR